MENAKSTSYFGTAFGREGSSPFSCTAIILVTLYIQERKGMEKGQGCVLEKVSWWTIETANVCNCVKYTIQTGIEKHGREIGGGELVDHSNC